MAKFQPWEYVGADAVCVSGGPTTNPKKMTGTRLGKILGLDSYGSPFQAWCEIMRVAEPPFEGNKYTEAGNAIEPKIIAWCKENVSPYVYTPEEFYGVVDAKRHMGYDFFPNHPVLGGMWDAVILSTSLEKFRAGEGSILGYVECKTSSRPQDWVSGVPLKYAVQGLLYAYLDGLDRVFIPVRFMEPHEYDNPHACECTDDNTEMYELRVSETRVNGKLIGELVEEALAWYETHCTGNVSPTFDKKKDAEYLKLMKSNEVKCEGLAALAREVEVLEAKIEMLTPKVPPKVEAQIKELTKQLKLVKEKKLKPGIVAMFDAPEYANAEEIVAYGWKVKRGINESIDKEALEQAGLLAQYTVTEPKYTMTRVKE